MRWDAFVKRAIGSNARQGAELLEALAFAAETDDERDVIEYAGTAAEAMTDLDAPVVRLVSFEWNGGLYGSVVGLDLLDGGDCGLVLLWNDDEDSDLRVVAHIPSRPDPPALVAALAGIDPSIVLSPYAAGPDTVTIHEPLGRHPNPASDRHLKTGHPERRRRDVDSGGERHARRRDEQRLERREARAGDRAGAAGLVAPAH